MIVFALHLCLLCWHGNPVVWWSSPHYEQCQITLLIFWTSSLFSNLKLDGIDSTVIIFVYTRAKPVISLLVSGWYAWWHAQVCWRLWDNPTYITTKKAKHLEDSETTPKSCLDVVFKLLETSSQTSSQNSLSESVRLLQSHVLAERHSATQLQLEVLSLRTIAGNPMRTSSLNSYTWKLWPTC